MQAERHIALVGNPNSGKTTLFNRLTGLNQRVGNFPGVTVDKKTGSFSDSKGQRVRLIDLPGIYSLTPKSLDEELSCATLLADNSANRPDGLILVLDASNLKRNLFLASQVLDLGYPSLVVLNMQDLAEKSGININADELSGELGVPVISISAKEGQGVDQIIARLDEMAVAPPTYKPKNLAALKPIEEAFNTRSPYHAFKLLANIPRWRNGAVLELIKPYEGMVSEDIQQEDIQDISARYEHIFKWMKVHSVVKKAGGPIARTQWFDNFATHPIWGVIIFLFSFFLLFQAVFTLAAYPMDWIDSGMAALGEAMIQVLPDNMFTSFLIDGVWTGLAGIVVFLPQIMILFGLVSILEESGYMARVSFMNDRILRAMGMSGKSTVSLIGGFACAVPAIMAARNIENYRERIITIFITPFMSCSARLPVYVFLVSFIVPDETVFGVLNLQGLFMFGLYLLGIIMAGIIGVILNLLLPKTNGQSMLMELPVYRTPHVRTTVMTMYHKGRTFLFEAGKIIMIISMVLWALTTFGPSEEMAEVAEKYAQLEQSESNQSAMNSEMLQHSYAGHIGLWLEPLIEPIGFDWKIGIALVTSFAAREVFVSTMSVIYGGSGGDASIDQLRELLMNSINPDTGLALMSMPTAASLLIFYVFAMQCMSTLAIVQRETQSWFWPGMQLIFFTLLAYAASYVTYQIALGWV